jgi:putative Ca2+/H+ antiporter (TMEM165/GDT1 family)
MSTDPEASPNQEPAQPDHPGQPDQPGKPDQGAPIPENGSAPAWGVAFITTFTTVFLAELGDKTQLAALLLSAQSGKPGVVFIGASLALICSSLVGVLLGRWLSKLMPPQQLERLAGILMVALGLWLGRQAVVALAPESLPLT